MEGLGRLRAVVVREVQDLARRRTPFVLRTIFGLIMGMTVFGPLMAMSGQQAVPGSQLTYFVFTTFQGLTFIQCPLLLATGVVLGIASSSSEKRNRTLGLLMLSRLRAWEIVAGKIIALLALIFMVYIVMLPALAILGWLGGIDYSWLAKSALLAMTVALLGASLGVTLGFVFRNLGLGTIAALLIGFSILYLPALTTVLSLPDWLYVTTAMSTAATQGVDGNVFYLPLGIVVGVCVVLGMIGSMALVRLTGREAGKGLRGSFERLDRVLDRINVGGIRFERRGSRFSGANPVARLARTTVGFGMGRYALRVFLFTTGVTVLLIAGLVQERGWAFTVSVIAVPLLFLVPLAAGANAVAGERASKSLVPLLSTPLTARQLIVGKTIAAVQFFGLLVIAPVIIYTGFAIVAGPGGGPFFFLQQILPGGSHYYAILFFLVQAVCAYSLALTASMLVDTTLRAGVLAITLLAGVNMIPVLVAGLLFFVLETDNRWADVGAGMLGAMVVVLAVVYFSRYRGEPQWDFRALLGLMVVLSGVLAALPFRGSTLMDHAGNLVSSGLGLVRRGQAEFVIYLAFILCVGLTAFVFAIRRFDDAVGRAR